VIPVRAWVSLLLLPSGLSPDAEPALRRAQTLFADGAAHVARFVQTYTPAGFANAKKESGEIWIQSPQRLRFEYSDPEKKIFTYDGSEGRLYVAEDRQLTIQRFSEDQREKLPVLLLTDPEKFSREYTVTTEAGSGAGDRLIFKPRAARPELAWLRLTVAKDGAVSGLSYEDSSGNRTEFRFEGWRREKARAASDYRVTGPPGTRVLEN
jgi:outer membrane lipoprotein carrier protein